MKTLYQKGISLNLTALACNPLLQGDKLGAYFLTVTKYILN
jgi:hypothetical protein